MLYSILCCVCEPFCPCDRHRGGRGAKAEAAAADGTSRFSLLLLFTNQIAEGAGSSRGLTEESDAVFVSLRGPGRHVKSGACRRDGRAPEDLAWAGWARRMVVPEVRCALSVVCGSCGGPC